jgi:parallel beta-helix repeat protein
MRHALGAAVVMVLAATLFAPAAWARPAGTIDVQPGMGTLAAALAGASPGDVLLLHAGVFTGPVAVSVPDITVRPAGDGPVTIDGGCQSIAAITVAADGLTMTGPMTVTGGHIYELTFFGQATGSVDGLTLDPGSCRGSVGIFLQRTGAIHVSHVSMGGFVGAGIEVFGITDAGGDRLTLSSNRVANSGYGILAEDVAAGTVAITGNRLTGSQFGGISLIDGDGMLIRGNVASNDGTYGIALDQGSDGNRVVRNWAHGSEFDLSNAGAGNCFRKNRYGTSQGDIGC